MKKIAVSLLAAACCFAVTSCSKETIKADCMKIECECENECKCTEKCPCIPSHK